MNYYPYRLVFPTGKFLNKPLPFDAKEGDILGLLQGDFMVIGTARMAFCDETMLFLERWL